MIVPHYDDLASLDRCLSARRGQTYPAERFEIIVADNMSPIGAKAVAQIIGDRGRLVSVAAARSSSRNALTAMPVSRLTSRAKAYFDVRSTATKRCSLPSSARTSAMSMWK